MKELLGYVIASAWIFTLVISVLGTIPMWLNLVPLASLIAFENVTHKDET